MATQLGKGTRITGMQRASIRKEIAAQYEMGTSIRTLADSTGHPYGLFTDSSRKPESLCTAVELAESSLPGYDQLGPATPVQAPRPDGLWCAPR